MHPLFEGTSSLTDQEIEDKIILLNRRYFQTQNPQVQTQITSLLDDYKLELESRRARQKLDAQQQQEKKLESNAKSTSNQQLKSKKT